MCRECNDREELVTCVFLNEDPTIVTVSIENIAIGEGGRRMSEDENISADT